MTFECNFTVKIIPKFFYSPLFFISVLLKLTSHVILHYFWSANLFKSFSQLIRSMFVFLNIFCKRFCSVEKFGDTTPHCLYRDLFNFLKKYVFFSAFLPRHIKYQMSASLSKICCFIWLRFICWVYHN